MHFDIVKEKQENQYDGCIEFFHIFLIIKEENIGAFFKKLVVYVKVNYIRVKSILGLNAEHFVFFDASSCVVNDDVVPIQEYLIDEVGLA